MQKSGSARARRDRPVANANLSTPENKQLLKQAKKQADPWNDTSRRAQKKGPAALGEELRGANRGHDSFHLNL